MTYTVYLKSGNTINGVNQKVFDALKNTGLNMRDFDPRACKNWGGDNMIDLAMVEAIWPELENKA